MSRRLTPNMRRVLQNLVDNKPAHDGLPMMNHSNGIASTPLSSVMGALRKRGCVAMQRDTTYRITEEGRRALEEHVRSIQ